MTPSPDRIDQVCDDFERAWREGHRPRIEDYLGQAEGAMRERLWNELLLSELECRRRRGEQPTLEEYRQRFPNWREALETHFQPPATVPAAPPSPPPPMTRIGQYELVRKIGTGGMGEVYEGRHALMKRRVAVKVLRREVLGHPDAVARFRREIEAAARLSHPNIVQALDAAEADGLHFLVMEYVEGTDLQRLVDRDGPLPVAVACEYVRQAARGLQHAFERGLVHRDVKPANLLLANDGTVKIVDLGLATLDRMGPDPSTLTPAGLVVGTPDYLAPEQARQARSADIRSDVYSLGCTLYFLLTARTPYPRGTLTETLLAHQSGKHRPVEELRPEVPVALRAVLRRMMALKPGDRFATPNEVASALEPFAQPSLQPPPARPPRRGRRMLLGSLLLIAMASFLVWLLRGGPRDGRRPEPASSPLDRLTTVQRTETSSWWSEELVGVLGDERWRHWTTISALAVSPDRGLVASGGHDGLVNVWDPRSGERVADLPGDGTVYGLTFTPGRAALVVVRKGGIQVYETTQWQKKTSYGLPGGVEAAALAPDGKRVAFGIRDSRVFLGGLAGVGRREIGPRHRAGVNALAFNPTGLHLASASADGSLHCWDPGTGKPRFSQDCEAGPVCSVAFCGENNGTLATGHDGGRIRLWDATSGAARASLSAERGTIWALAGSPTGSLLVAGSHEGTLSFWGLGRDKAETRLPAHHGSIAAMAFSADGGTLFTAGSDPVIRSWDVKSRKELSPDRGSGTMVGAVAVAPDGLTVATTSNDRGVRVWGIDGREQGRLPGDLGSVGSVAFSPDGRWVAAGTYSGLHLWDRSTGKAHHPQRPITEGVFLVTFTSDGLLLATANRQPSIRLWEVASGREYADLNVSGRVTALATAPRTRLAAVASGPQEKAGTVVLWDWAQKKTTELRHSHPVQAMAFAPSGEQLACGDGTTVKVWDVKGGTLPRILEGHPGTVNGVVYAAEGATLVSADSDGRVMVWDAATGHRRHRWQLPGKINGLAVAPDGRHLVTANANGTAYILRLPR